MDDQEKPGFTSPAAGPESAADAALAKALLLKPDMTEDEINIFLRAYERAEAKRQEDENSAVPPEQPLPPQDQNEHRQREEDGAQNKRSLWKDVLAAANNHLKALPFGIGGAIDGAENLYQNNKTFRYGLLAATLPFWAYPKYSWKAARAVIDNGPGGLKGILRTAKNTVVGGSFMASAAVKKTVAVGLLALLAYSGMKGMTDTYLGRSGPLDGILNGLSSTFSGTFNTGGKMSHAALPKVERAYGVAEGAVVSGFNNLDGTVSSGTDTINGAVASGSSTVNNCLDKAEDCGKALGDTVLHTGGNILSLAVGTWAQGYSWAIDRFYSTAVPAVGKFAWDNTVCNVFNCNASSGGKPALTSDASGKPKSFSDGNRKNKPKTSPLVPENSPVTATNLLANLDYTHTGSRYVSVCTLRAMDQNGDYYPVIDQLKDKSVLSAHNERVGLAVEAMKSDRSSPLYHAVMDNKARHVVVIASAFNSGAATAQIKTEATRIGIPPSPAHVNGAGIPYLCREYGMDAFLKGTGINPYKIPENPQRVLG